MFHRLRGDGRPPPGNDHCFKMYDLLCDGIGTRARWCDDHPCNSLFIYSTSGFVAAFSVFVVRMCYMPHPCSPGVFNRSVWEIHAFCRRRSNTLKCTVMLITRL